MSRMLSVSGHRYIICHTDNVTPRAKDGKLNANFYPLKDYFMQKQLFDNIIVRNRKL